MAKPEASVFRISGVRLSTATTGCLITMYSGTQVERQVTGLTYAGLNV